MACRHLSHVLGKREIRSCLDEELGHGNSLRTESSHFLKPGEIEEVAYFSYHLMSLPPNPLERHEVFSGVGFVVPLQEQVREAENTAQVSLQIVRHELSCMPVGRFESRQLLVPIFEQNGLLPELSLIEHVLPKLTGQHIPSAF